MAWRIDFGVLESIPYFEFDGEGRPGWVWGAGRTVANPALRLSAVQRDTHKLTDFFPLPGSTAVSSRFREMVKQVEPGVHEFFPIALKTKNGQPISEKYFILNVAQMFDAILFSAEAVQWSTKKAGPFKGMPFVIAVPAPFQICKRLVSGRHIWRYHLVTNQGVMISDALDSVLLENKVRHLQLKKPWAEHFEEVDREFSYDMQAPQICSGWIRTSRPRSAICRPSG